MNTPPEVPLSLNAINAPAAMADQFVFMLSKIREARREPHLRTPQARMLFLDIVDHARAAVNRIEAELKALETELAKESQNV